MADITISPDEIRTALKDFVAGYKPSGATKTEVGVNDARDTRSVDFYLGCTGALAEAVRPRIEQLANSIDEQLDTRRWIGTPEAPGAVEHADR